VNTSMFAQLIGVFQGSFFSRAFWLGNFIPVAVVAAAHLFMASHVFPGVPTWQLLGVESSPASRFPLVLALLIVVAYAVAPLIPVMRGILDGSLLPGWLHDALRREHVIKVRSLRETVGKSVLLYGNYDLLCSLQPGALKAARQAGDGTGKPLEGELLAGALQDIAKMRASSRVGRVPPIDVARAACSALDKALRAGSAALTPDLDQAHRQLLKLLLDAKADACHDAVTLKERVGRALSLDNPQATRMADARLLTEQYSLQAYGVKFDYLWPRIQLVMPEQGALVDRIAAAKSQLDFALLSLVLLLTLAAIWIPLLAWLDPRPWYFLGLVTLLPAAAGFLYELAVQTQLSVGDSFEAITDRYRFDVLKTVLSVALPATLGAERALWKELQNATQDGLLTTDFTYRHPTS
jgi:hypothetical protein